jgi:heparanase 1
MKLIQISCGVHQQPGKNGLLTSAGISLLSISVLVAVAAMVCWPKASFGQATISPKSMKVLGQVDPRYVSYNVEAVEVTGGRFWAPYKSLSPEAAAPPPAAAQPSPGTAAHPDPGAFNSRFQYRSPIDLSNPKLRKLAAALGPAYIRVSGTWRNSTYFQDNDEPALKTPPTGYQNILTRSEWKGVVDFAHAVNAEIVASVTTSAGVRDSDGVWTSAQAKAWLDYTRSVGGRIAAIEFMNEPTLMMLGGVSDKYGASEYARDSKIFKDFLGKESPGTLYLGPSSAGEGLSQTAPLSHLISTEQLMQATGPLFDGFSYHVYNTRSHRCSGPNGTDVNQVLTAEWFDRGRTVEQFYANYRDKYLPGKDLWLTETGEASCGGDTWASTFIDSFRLLDQFGSLAQKSVKSIMYNTLASSDYGMIDEETYAPRPNYWAALLWNRTMGTRSLDSGINPSSEMRIYAQCMKDAPGGVAMLILNVDKSDAHSLALPVGGKRYTLSSPDLLSKTVLLNGQELKVAADGTVPEYKGEQFKQGIVSFAPTTISVITLPNAGNASCTRQ